MPTWSFVANLCTYANHYYELCIYACFHIIILYSYDGSGNCRNMLVLKLKSVIQGSPILIPTCPGGN